VTAGSGVERDVRPTRLTNLLLKPAARLGLTRIGKSALKIADCSPGYQLRLVMESWHQ